MEDYKILDTDMVIEKNTPIFISMLGLHYDSKYFPEPDKFDPERFNVENNAIYHHVSICRLEKARISV
jgi:cytochrome P450 family 6